MKHYSYYAVTKLDNSKLTDTATAYTNKQVRIMCYQALKTNFANSGNPYVLDIMKTAFESSINENNKDYKEIIENEYNGVKLMTVKKHERKKVNGVYIPCKPFETLELTQAGREFMQETTASNSHFTEPCINFNDLVQTAWTYAIMPLNEIGLLVNFDSVWMFKNLVYHAVHNMFYSERRHETRKEFSLDSTERKPEKDIAQEQAIEDVETSVLFEQIKQEVFTRLDARTNKEKAWAAWTLVKIEQASKTYVASVLCVNEKQIRRWTTQIQTVVESLYEMFA